MDTDRLRYFCTVVQTENLQRAAEILHISAPALSKSIKALEAELEQKLITHVGRGIATTDDGVRVAEQSRRVLNEVDRLRTNRTKKTDVGLLRIGSFEVFTTYFLGPCLQDHLTNVDLELHELVPGKMKQSLLNRETDLGITYIPIPNPQLDYLKVTEIQMGIFGYSKLACTHPIYSR